MTIVDQAKNWTTSTTPIIPPAEFYCETRDIFKARHERMLSYFLEAGVAEDISFMLLAITGEIGNNSFDHNLGGWPNVMGIFFGYEIKNTKISIILADRGRGVLNTLQRVRPSIHTDIDALQVAFSEKLSGRAPEARGNGLKFVRTGIREQKMHLTFLSGDAQADLNDEMKINPTDVSINGCLAIITK